MAKLEPPTDAFAPESPGVGWSRAREIRRLMCGPPVGGTFWFQLFIQASSPETWRKTIFGGEGGCWRGKWGGLFWATSLKKIFGGVIAIISFRPGGWMQQSAVPRCANLSVGSTGGIGQ